MAGFYFVGIILVFVGLVLALVILLLKSKALKCTRRSLNAMQKDPAINAKPLCQTCHVCGGLRKRPQNQASTDHLKVSRYGNQLNSAISGQCRPIQHTWAEIGVQMRLFFKQAVQKLINYHKKQVHIEVLMKLSRLISSRKQKSDWFMNEGCALPTFEDNFDCTSATSEASSDEGTGRSNAIDAVPENESEKGLVAQGNLESTGIDPSDGSVHRVILELLVSRCDNHKESSGMHSPGITLTLKTGAAWGHLAGCVDAMNNTETKNPLHNYEATQALPGAFDSLPEEAGSFYANDSQICPTLKEIKLSAKDEINLSDFPISKMGTKDFNHSCHVLEESTDSWSSNDGPSVIEESLPHLGHPKLRVSSCMHGTGRSNVPVRYTVEKKKASGMASRMPMDNVGSLSVSFLNLGQQEENAGQQAASVLASLNVAENHLNGTNLNMEKSNKACVPVNTGCNNTSTLTKAPEAEGSSVKEEGNRLFQGSIEENSIDECCSPPKKIKKKKKMKGKKPKAAESNSIMDAKQMQEIGRVALEVSKYVSAVPEREYGCVCGAMKGGHHNETCSFPFTCSGSVLQRKLQEQYNQLVRSNAAKTLTLAQVGQFASCLVEAKVTLQQKSETIQRKYIIAKSLLSKADKSSFDRLRSQIYGLEMEQKKLEEDTIVYNRLQAQLKLSPAYHKMLEYGRAHFELQSNSGQVIEKLQPEDLEMSFEDLLEQEKKDVFWQKRNLSRSALPSR